MVPTGDLIGGHDMRYPADMIIEIEKEINANIENGISILDSIDMAYGIARKRGFCGLDPMLEKFVRAGYKSKIGPEACEIIDWAVSESVRLGWDKERAIFNAFMQIIWEDLRWSNLMRYYAEEIYYDKAYVDTVTNRIE